MDQQAAERAAIVNFMGTIFGQARKLDQDMVQRSSTLQPTSHKAEQALRDFLQQSQPAFIPPAPQEIVSAGGQLPPPPPVYEQPIYDQPAPTTVPVFDQPVITTPVVPPFIPPPPSTLHTQNNDSLFEISKKLDILIELVSQLVTLQKNSEIYEDPVRQSADVKLPRSGSEG